MANRRTEPNVKETRIKLGYALFDLQKRLGLRPKDVSAEIGVNAGSLSRVKKGESLPVDQLKSWIDFIATESTRRGVTEAVFDFMGDRTVISLRRLYELAKLDVPQAIRHHTPQGLSATWAENITAGKVAHAAGHHIEANTWLHTANKLATTDGQRALAEALIGLIQRDLNNLHEAELHSRESLKLLGLGDINLSRSAVSRPALAKRLHSDEEFAAFAVSAKTFGQIYSSREHFTSAGRAYQSLINVSTHIPNGDVHHAEGLHHLGTSLIEAGTRVGEAPEWRTVGNRQLIEKGLVKIRQSREIRLKRRDDPVGIGHDWHQEFKAHLLFEDFANAERAMLMADEFYGDSPARINRAVDRARLAMSRGESAIAREQHEMTVDIAKEINSPHQLSRAYTGLAMHFFVLDDFAEAKRYSISAIWTWPFDFDARDFELPMQIFRATDGRPEDFGLMVPLVSFARAQKIVSEVDRRFEGA